MKLFLSLFLLSVFISGCTSGSKENLLVINLYDLENIEKQDISLEEISSNIKIIPIDTTGSFIMNRPSNMRVTSDELYIYAYPDLLQFDLDGRLKRKIATRGRGPHEYNSLANFFVTDKTIYIFDASDANILSFSKTGEFEGRFYLKELGISPRNEVHFINEDEFVGFCPDLALPESEIMLTFFNHSGVSGSVSHTNPIKSDASIAQIYLYDESQFINHNREIKFKHIFNDTIYQVKSHEIIPSIVLDLGEKRAIEHARVHSLNPDYNIWDNMTRVDLRGETERYLYLYSSGENYLYDKEREETAKVSFTIPLGQYINSENNILKAQFIDANGRLIGWTNPINENENPTIIIAKIKD